MSANEFAENEHRLPFLVRAILWIVLLPFRIVFWILSAIIAALGVFALYLLGAVALGLLYVLWMGGFMYMFCGFQVCTF